ncbi:hypothetical protein F4819DRAFT_442411 [Hypoxylon fuscum]|nr:hypothetical protein F4819DRAFT_442411 [Hypoxylon fuscum]
MHALKNYKKEDIYDNNAYTYSSAYHAGTGTLILYSHHARPPPPDDEQPQYITTQLAAFAIIGNKRTFIDGATAFRNVRDLAFRERQSLIMQANERVKEKLRKYSEPCMQSRPDKSDVPAAVHAVKSSRVRKSTSGGKNQNKKSAVGGKGLFKGNA